MHRLWMLLWLTTPIVASADAPLRVLVVGSPTSLARRITVELEALGFDVVQVPADEVALPQLLTQHSAVSAIVADADVVSIWTGSRSTELRNDGATITAVRAVELVRAALLDVPRRDPPNDTQRNDSLVFGAQASVGVGGSLDRVGPVPLIRVGLVTRLRAWRTSITIELPLTSSELVETEGRSTQWFGRGIASVNLNVGSGPVAPTFGLGLFAVYLRSQGTSPSPTFEARTNTAWGAGMQLEVGLDWRIARWVSLQIQASAGVMFHDMDVVFAGRRVAGLSTPFLAGGIGVWVLR